MGVRLGRHRRAWLRLDEGSGLLRCYSGLHIVANGRQRSRKILADDSLDLVRGGRISRTKLVRAGNAPLGFWTCQVGGRAGARFGGGHMPGLQVLGRRLNGNV